MTRSALQPLPVYIVFNNSSNTVYGVFSKKETAHEEANLLNEASEAQATVVPSRFYHD